MTLEQEALAFIEQLQTLYYEQRDIEAVLASMAEDITWIGTGRRERCHGLTEARGVLTRELQEYGEGFAVTDSGYEAVALSDGLCVVYGQLSASSVCAEVADLYQRLTAVCRRTPQGLKLVHLHLSLPDLDQREGEFYARKGERTNSLELRRKMEETAQQLRLRNRELETLTQNIPGGVQECLNDPYMTILSASQSFYEMFGYSQQEVEQLFHNQFINMIYPGDRATVLKENRRQLLQGTTVECEYRVLRRDGTVVWVLDKSRYVTAEDGSQRFYCVLLDITGRKREQEELRLSLERHQVIMDQTTDIIFEWDIRSDTLDFSSNWRKKFGYDPIDYQISSRIPQSRNLHPEDMAAFVKLMRDTAAGVPYSETEFRIRDAEGVFRWCQIRATTQYDGDGTPIKAVGVIIDIDEEKKQREKLLDQASKDALTGLWNKTATQNRISEYLAEEGLHALIMFDLDNFKTVNDRFGHLCGDAVLSDLAGGLRKLFRATDVVGRIGGDEFLVFLPWIQDRELAVTKARGILEAVRQVGERIQSEADLSCSVGIAFSPDDAADYAQLYQCADQALYYAKNRGKRNFALYEEVRETPQIAVHTAISGSIDSEVITDVDEKLAQYCFRMLYGAADIQRAIPQLLEIIGRAYDVSRVYIFENSPDNATCSNTFEWCNDGVEPQMEELQNIPYTGLADYQANFDEDGVFYCQDISSLHPDVYAKLQPQGICSMLQCAIRDRGAFRGYIGFDECRLNRCWTRKQVASLSLIASVLSTFLLKHRLQEKLEEKI